jgi:hypothetical protein
MADSNRTVNFEIGSRASKRSRETAANLHSVRVLVKNPLEFAIAQRRIAAYPWAT